LRQFLQRSFWVHQSFRRLRHPIRWMKTLPWPCSFAPLSATVSMRNESHWIASLTTQKKRQRLILSLLFARNTTPNAAEIPKRVRSLTDTAFIGDLGKSNYGKRLTTPGSGTSPRKAGSGVNEF